LGQFVEVLLVAAVGDLGQHRLAPLDQAFDRRDADLALDEALALGLDHAMRVLDHRGLLRDRLVQARQEAVVAAQDLHLRGLLELGRPLLAVVAAVGGQAIGLLLLGLGVRRGGAHGGHLLVAALLFALQQQSQQGQAFHARLRPAASARVDPATARRTTGMS
jgi:hypothetical protein